MMFSRAASLRRLAATASSSLLRPAAAASSPLSTTAKRAPKKAAVPAPEAASTSAPKKAAVKRAPRKAAVPAPEAASTTAPNKAAVKRAPRKAAVPSPEAVVAAAPPQQAASDLPLPPPAKVKRAPRKAAVPATEAASTTAPNKAAVKRAPRKAAVPSPEAVVAAAPPQQAASDLPLPPPPPPPAKVKRPTEIPFQPQVANTVHLVGTVGVQPVLEKNSSGECKAVTVIVEKNDLLEDDSSQLWIPVIFQGDLAEIAADHLKENDLIYIVGQLSGDEPTTTVEDAHNKIRVFARSLSFVESNCQDKKRASDRSGNVKDESRWTDVFANPGDWEDNRINKQNGTVGPRYPDFTHKSSGQALWLSSSPGWVQLKLDDLKTFGTSDLTYDSTSKKTLLPNKKKNDLWKDVIENPTKWWDRRLNKRNPKAADFMHKDSGDGLWLDTAPSWVLEKLPPAETATNTDGWATATILS